MWTAIQVIKMARCGELSKYCCLSAADLKELRDGLRGMPDDDIDLLHSLACGCTPQTGTTSSTGAGNNTTPGEAAASSCRQAFIATLCTQGIQTTIAMVDEAIGVLALAGGLSGKIPARAVKALLALSAAFSAWRLACETQSATAAAIHGICYAYNGMKDVMSLLPGDLDKSIASGLTKFLGMQDVAAAINRCCNTDEITGASLPDWATDPTNYILTSASSQTPVATAADWWSEATPGNLTPTMTV